MRLMLNFRILHVRIYENQHLELWHLPYLRSKTLVLFLIIRHCCIIDGFTLTVTDKGIVMGAGMVVWLGNT